LKKSVLEKALPNGSFAKEDGHGHFMGGFLGASSNEGRSTLRKEKKHQMGSYASKDINQFVS
jgi:hypothetical protein